MLNSSTLEKAKQLRESGHTYREIVEALHGQLSLDQCKKNLKDVLKPEQDDACLNELIQLATRPEGVSVYEANGVIMNHNKDKQLTKDQIRYIRTKAKAKNPTCMFRPDWVSTTNPQDSYRAFCAYVLHMQDEVDNLVRWYCEAFPDTKESSVKYELLEYLKPTKDGISLKSRIDRAELLTEEMQKRLTAL